MNFDNPKEQVTPWLEVLPIFSITIEHRPDRLHGNAGGLSRKPSDADRCVENMSLTNAGHSNQNCMQVCSAIHEIQSDKVLNLDVLQTKRQTICS